MPPKGAGSWPLAGGRNSTAACTKGENPNFQLWRAMWLFCPLSSQREGTATSTNQAELLKTMGCFSSPQQLPFLLPSPHSWPRHSFWPNPLGTLLILSVFPHLLLICLQWLLACQEGTDRRSRKGRKVEGQGLQKEGQVMSIFRFWGPGEELKLNLTWIDDGVSGFSCLESSRKWINRMVLMGQEHLSPLSLSLFPPHPKMVGSVMR